MSTGARYVVAGRGVDGGVVGDESDCGEEAVGVAERFDSGILEGFLIEGKLGCWFLDGMLCGGGVQRMALAEMHSQKKTRGDVAVAAWGGLMVSKLTGRYRPLSVWPVWFARKLPRHFCALRCCSQLFFVIPALWERWLRREAERMWRLRIGGAFAVQAEQKILQFANCGYVTLVLADCNVLLTL